MMPKGPVLVATSLDEGSDYAVDQAAAVAQASHSEVHLCHVLPESYGYRPLFPHLRELERSRGEEMRQAAATAIHDQLRRINLVRGSSTPKVSVESGSPHGGILRLAEQLRPSLIVMGASPGTFGGITERVVRYAACPVLVAVRHPGRVVLAATDFSDPALPAVHAGIDEGRRRGLPCRVLHSVEFAMVPASRVMGGEAPITADMLDAMRAEASERLDRLGSQFTPPVQTILSMGPAADAILLKADELEAELIVIGTHGRSGLQRLAFGSVAEGVVRRSRCSVLVVRLNE